MAGEPAVTASEPGVSAITVESVESAVGPTAESAPDSRLDGVGILAFAVDSAVPVFVSR